MLKFLFAQLYVPGCFGKECHKYALILLVFFDEIQIILPEYQIVLIIAFVLFLPFLQLILDVCFHLERAKGRGDDILQDIHQLGRTVEVIPNTHY